MRQSWIAFLIIGFLFGACGEDTPTPKPRIYPRVEYPRGEWTSFEDSNCPFSFEYPDYVEVKRSETYARMNPVHPCWFNLVYPMFNAEIYCSYVPVNSRAEFDEVRMDAFEIIDQINKRSDYMEEIPFRNPQGVSGLVFDFSGPAASPFQFYLTDTSQHFFKGALYFNTQVRPDSLAPVAEFVKQDLERMMMSFHWD